MPTIINPMPVLTMAALTATIAARVTVAMVDQVTDHVSLSPVRVAVMADLSPESAVRNPVTKEENDRPLIVLPSVVS